METIAQDYEQTENIVTQVRYCINNEVIRTDSPKFRESY